jgi:hypothetical protein
MLKSSSTSKKTFLLPRSKSVKIKSHVLSVPILKPKLSTTNPSPFELTNNKYDELRYNNKEDKHINISKNIEHRDIRKLSILERLQNKRKLSNVIM